MVGLIICFDVDEVEVKSWAMPRQWLFNTSIRPGKIVDLAGRLAIDSYIEIYRFMV